MPTLFDLPLPTSIRGNIRSMVISPRPPGPNENGGVVTIAAQNATGINRAGGSVSVTGGNGTGTGNGGGVTFLSGTGQTGGNLQLLGGPGIVTGGAFLMAGGDCFTAGAVGGNLELRGGNSNAGDGGNVTITTGAGGVTNGTCTFQPAGVSNAAFTFGDDYSEPYISFFGVPLVVQQNTGISSATFSAVAGTPVTETSTFDGYTLAQVVSALRNYGLLA